MNQFRRVFLAASMVVFFGLTAQLSWGIPSKITYQGTLKERNLPANGNKTMRFRITNETGTQVY